MSLKNDRLIRPIASAVDKNPVWIMRQAADIYQNIFKFVHSRRFYDTL